MWEGLEGEAGGSNVWVYNNSPDRDFIKDAIARRTRLQLVRGSRGLHHKRVSRPNPFPPWKNKQIQSSSLGENFAAAHELWSTDQFPNMCACVYTLSLFRACVCVTFSNLQCRQGCGLFGLMAEKPIFTVFSKSHLNVSPLSEKVIRTVHYHKIKGERFRVISLHGITKYASFTGKQGMCLKL